MTKAELKMLEKLYGAEIEAALSHQPLRSIVQTHSKAMQKLKEYGYAQEVVRLVGRPQVTVRGWELTLAGNLAYCMSCNDDSPGDSQP